MQIRAAFRSISGNILVFATTDLLGNIARGMVFPYASLYILALGGDAALIGLVGFLTPLAGLILLPLAGHITDHANRVHVITFAGFLSTAFILLMIFAPGWQLVALASMLMGTVVFQFPAYAALVADSLKPGERGLGLGLQNTISSSLSIFAPYVAGVVIQHYSANLGMRILYAVMAVLYLISTVIQVRYLKETSQVAREPMHLPALVNALGQAYRGIPALVRQMSTQLRILALIVVLSFVASALTGPFWVVFATGRLGLNPAQWGVIMLVDGIVRMAVFLPAGLLVDRWGRTTTLILALVLSTLTTPLFILFSSFGAILAVRVAQAAAFSLALPACMALMTDFVPRSIRGQMMAAIGQGGIVLGMIGSPGGPAVGYLIIPALMVASLGGGLLYTLNPIYPWIGSTVAGLLAIALTAIYIRDPHHAEQ
jgi:MFS family permease